jgi:hypothetical protein
LSFDFGALGAAVAAGVEPKLLGFGGLLTVGAGFGAGLTGDGAAAEVVTWEGTAAGAVGELMTGFIRRIFDFSAARHGRGQSVAWDVPAAMNFP